MDATILVGLLCFIGGAFACWLMGNAIKGKKRPVGRPPKEEEM